MAVEGGQVTNSGMGDRERVLKYGYPAMEVPFALGEYRERLRRVREAMAQ
jgi:hypothetical protein